MSAFVFVLSISSYAWSPTGNHNNNGNPINDDCDGAITIQCDGTYEGSFEGCSHDDVEHNHDYCHHGHHYGDDDDDDDNDDYDNDDYDNDDDDDDRWGWSWGHNGWNWSWGNHSNHRGGNYHNWNSDDDDDDDDDESAPGVWYSFIGNGQNVTINLSENDADLEVSMFLFTGVCPSLSCHGTSYNDSDASELYFFADLGVEYFIHVVKHGSGNGSYNLSVDCTPNCEPMLEVRCPNDVAVNCGQIDNIEITGFPGLQFNACGDSLSVNYSDITISSTPFQTVISRTWIVTLGSLSHTCTQIITVTDSEGPVFSNVVPEIQVQCREDLPGSSEVTAYDLCSGDRPVDVLISNTGTRLSSCSMTSAYGPGADWSFWFPELATSGIAANANFHFVTPGILEQFADGTARLTGTVANSANAAQQFQVTIWMNNKSDWSAWSAQGRSYKDDLNCATPSSLYELWTYYEIVDGFSNATGLGDLAGVNLYFQHSPSNHYFGAQIGQGANNKNCDFGASAWFTYTGFNGNTPITGHGDFNLNASCTPDNREACLNNTSYTYTYMSVDAAGHYSYATTTVLVEDTTAPEFTNCQANITILCSDEIPAAVTPEAIDNCTGEVTVTPVPEVYGGTDCERTITRAWVASDACGNRATCSYIITIVDTIAPSFPNLPAEELTVQCDQVPAQEVLVATDLCDENVDVVPSEEIIEGDCPGRYTIYRSWKATDNCNNTAVFNQTINVIDTTAPTFNQFPIYTHINCEDIDAYTLTATDNCGTASVEIVFAQLNSGGCLGVWHRIYRATDLCGNSAEVEQYITIVDRTAPSFSNIPASASVECSTVSANDNGYLFSDEVTATDNCGGNVSLQYAEQIVATDDNCPNSYDVIRVWTTTDECDNAADTTIVTHVVDTQAPIFDFVPADTTLSCEETIPTTNAEVHDACGTSEVAYADEIIEGSCVNTYSIRRVFRAADACGNSDIRVQMIYILDETAPIVEGQAEVIAECGQDVPYVEPTATDNCNGIVTIAHEDLPYEGEFSCPVVNVIVRKFTATDVCGNATDFYQTIYVKDTTAPVFAEFAMNIEKPCDDYAGIFVSASDLCSDVVITSRDERVSGGCAGKVIRTYYATDACNNVDSAMQIITLTDIVAPTAAEPADRAIECGSEWSADNVVFTDNCDDELDTTRDSVHTFDGCSHVYTFTWTATDNCGRIGTVDQVITVTDTQKPVFTFVPAGMTMSCDQEIEYATATASDCSEFEMTTSVDTTAGSCPNSYVITRTFRAEDACGNAETAIQTITVADTDAPSFAPDQQLEYTYECSDVIAPVQPVASDNCGGVTYNYTDSERMPNTTSIAGYNGEGIYLDLTAYSGPVVLTLHTEQESGIFHYVNIPGVAFVPENAGTLTYTLTGGRVYGPCTAPNGTLYIGNETPLGGINLVVVEEGGDDWNDMILTVEQGFFARLDEEAVQTDVCGEHFIRTWTATDDCGNVSRFVQRINIVDTTAPVVAEYDAEITRPCGDYEGIFITAEDNCNGVIITYTDVRYSGTCLGRIERTYHVQDSCGNVTSGLIQQIITLTDTENPVAVAQPQDLTLECGSFESIPSFMPEFTDNCDPDGVDITGDTTRVNIECGYEIRYHWRGTDNCNNSADLYQTITVIDTQDPYFTSVPEGYTAECSDELVYANATAADLCDSDVIVSVAVDTIAGDCPNSYTIRRTFRATDDCGRTASAVQNIEVLDRTAPNFTFVPANETVRCDLFNPGTASAEDVCGNATVTSTITEEPYNNPNAEFACGKIVTYAWEAKDDCNNVRRDTTVYIVYDNVAPTFVGTLPTEPIVVQCASEIPTFITLTATDVCGEAWVDRDEVVIYSDSCGNQMIEVVYVASDACGNTATASYQIHVEDTTDPQFDQTVSDITLTCNQDVPAAANLTATDNCSSNVRIEMEEHTDYGVQMPEGAVSACVLITPSISQATGCQSYYQNKNWAMWLGNLAPLHRYYSVSTGHLFTMNDGSLMIQATLVNTTNPALGGFVVSARFNNGLDWASWSTQAFPTSFKADCGGVSANHTSWVYYLLQNTPGAELTGFGAYNGSSLDLTHAPANKYFGFQYGNGANNLTPGEGLGGWFNYVGTVIYTAPNAENAEVLTTPNQVNAGDFAFNLDCCPKSVTTRCWTAFDCSGNTTTVCQTIRYEGASSPAGSGQNNVVDATQVEKGGVAVNVFPNPATTNATFAFVAAEDGKATIEVFTMTGARVAVVYNATVAAGSTYNVPVNLSELSTGVYAYRVTNGGSTQLGRLIVGK